MHVGRLREWGVGEWNGGTANHEYSHTNSKSYGSDNLEEVSQSTGLQLLRSKEAVLKEKITDVDSQTGPKSQEQQIGRDEHYLSDTQGVQL